MSKTITKTIQTIVALNEVAWYDKEKDSCAGLSNMARFNLKRNIKALREIADSFYEFRNEEDAKIRDKFTTDEMSEEKMIKDENGNEVPGRVVKDEYLDDLKKVQEEAQAKLNEILTDTEEVNLYVISLEDEIERADMHDVEIPDSVMDMISLFDFEDGE